MIIIVVVVLAIVAATIVVAVVVGVVSAVRFLFSPLPDVLVVVGVLCVQFPAAGWAGVVLLEPRPNAGSVKLVKAGKHGCLGFHIVLADRAAFLIFQSWGGEFVDHFRRCGSLTIGPSIHELEKLSKGIGEKLR